MILDAAWPLEVAGPLCRPQHEVEDSLGNVDQVSYDEAEMRHTMGLPQYFQRLTSPELEGHDESIIDIDSCDTGSNLLARRSETVMVTPRPLPLMYKTFMSSRLTNSTPILCNLSLSESQSSVSLWATTDTKPMTPRMLFYPDNRVPVYKHSLLPGVGSFPSVKHPSADTVTPMHKDAPYSIHFVKPQMQSVDQHSAHEYEPCGVKYHFEDREDRDVMRQTIFDKTLLVAVGVDKVWIKDKTACVTESLTLWQQHPVDGQPPDVTITFPYYTKPNSAAPECVIEYLVCPRENFVEDLRKAKREHKTLCLDVLPMPRLESDHEDDVGARQGSVYTVATSSTNASIRSTRSIRSICSRLSRRSSGAAFSPRDDITDVTIKFSESKEEYVTDKITFLNKLIQQFASRSQE